MIPVLPTVSVVLTTHDNGRVARRMVAALEAQVLAGAELVIWDDASTDAETDRFLHWAAGRGHRVHRAPHGGVVRARNGAAGLATGDYVCFLDPDDEVEPTFLHKLALALDFDGGVDLAYPWARMTGQRAGVWATERLDAATILRRNQLPMCALVRRRVLEATGGFSTALEHGYEDWELWVHAARLGFRGRPVPESVWHYTFSTDSGRDARARARHDSLVALIRRMHDGPLPVPPRPPVPAVGRVRPLRLPAGSATPILLTLPPSGLLSLAAWEEVVQVATALVNTGRTTVVLRAEGGPEDELDLALRPVTPFVYRMGTVLPSRRWEELAAAVLAALPGTLRVDVPAAPVPPRVADRVLTALAA